MNDAVLVIGAGVAGMQASVELIKQGFKVYLLEKESHIGGKMAIVDRVFPTHEHTACALQPLRLELTNNRNATILCSAEILSLRGQTGDFTAEVKIHESECDGNTRKVDINIGAVIVATGLEEDKGESDSQLGYGKFPDVLTGLEFEQQLSGLGPTGGEVRLKNGKKPERVTWYVAKEDSPVSFISAASQAMGLREKDKDAKASILYEERRIDGKGYQEFVQLSETQGVDYIQVNTLDVTAAQNDSFNLSYMNADNKKEEQETDMLILSLPLRPNDKTLELAERLGLEQEGVIKCGAVQGAMGIGESVSQACAAASYVVSLLRDVRGEEKTEAIEKKHIPVKAEDEPNIAVVIDRGDPDIAGLLDLDQLVKYTESLPGVTKVDMTACASDGTKIQEILSTSHFNRLIIAGPSPIPQEALFQQHAEKAGLNPYLVEMVNLHNQCVLVHSKDKQKATEKAKTLLKMGVARSRHLEPLEELKFDVTQSCMVIGGSSSGIACANRLAEMGIQAHLVDESPDLKGIHDNVGIHAPTTVEDIRGCLGDFKVELAQEEKPVTVQVGSIVIASETSTEKRQDSRLEESLALEKDQAGFFVTDQGILNPLDSLTSGVFICGKARAHMGEEDEAMDGEAAASRVASTLAAAASIQSPVISSVVNENCDGCAYCIDPCPTNSLTLLEYMQRGTVKKVAEANEVTCIGCGICMSTCPKEGIFVNHFRPKYFSEMVKAAMEKNESQPVIISFCCNRCAYPGADSAGTLGIQYPSNVLIIRTVCSGMIHPNIIIDALTQVGADGVLLCGCHPGNCRSRNGILKAQARAEAIELMLEDFALEQERFRIELIAASEGPKFARIIKEMTEELSALGPNPYR